MDANQVVIDNTFNSVETSKTEQHCPDQELRRPVEMPAVRRPPKEEQADQNEKICRTVKDAVPSRVEFQVLDGVDGKPTAEHVMPLQHLMQHDAIEETAQPEAEEYACRNRKMSACGRGGFCHPDRPPALPKDAPRVLNSLPLQFRVFLTLSPPPPTN